MRRQPIITLMSLFILVYVVGEIGYLEWPLLSPAPTPPALAQAPPAPTPQPEAQPPAAPQVQGVQLQPSTNSTPWGDWPDWIAAVAAVLAIIISSLSLWISLRPASIVVAMRTIEKSEPEPVDFDHYIVLDDIGEDLTTAEISDTMLQHAFKYGNQEIQDRAGVLSHYREPGVVKLGTRIGLSQYQISFELPFMNSGNAGVLYSVAAASDDFLRVDDIPVRYSLKFSPSAGQKEQLMPPVVIQANSVYIIKVVVTLKAIDAPIARKLLSSIALYEAVRDRRTGIITLKTVVVNSHRTRSMSQEIAVIIPDQALGQVEPQHGRNMLRAVQQLKDWYVTQTTAAGQKT